MPRRFSALASDLLDVPRGRGRKLARHEPKKSVLHRLVRANYNSLAAFAGVSDPAGPGLLQGPGEGFQAGDRRAVA